jgi:hypothetical protein
MSSKPIVMIQTSMQLTEGLREVIPIYKAGSSILSYELFWRITHGIIASFLKMTLNESGTMLCWLIILDDGTDRGLGFGLLFIIWMSSSQVKFTKRIRLFWTTLLSTALLVGSSMIFFVCIPRLGEESSSAGIILSTMSTVIYFAVMMISI